MRDLTSQVGLAWLRPPQVSFKLVKFLLKGRRPQSKDSTRPTPQFTFLRSCDGRRLHALSSSLLATALLPMEPRPWVQWRRPWFEGWFFRMTDHASRATIAVIFGSVRRREQRRLPPRDQPAVFDEHLLVLAYRDGRGAEVSRSVLLDGNEVVLGGGGEHGHGPRVSWWSARHGGMRVSDLGTEVDVRFTGGVRLVANLSGGARVPWSELRPNHDGPEGWLGRTGLLPCHYFVHSFGSPSTYAVWHGGLRARHLGGHALTHVERNYGTSFPTGWAWAQASAPAGRAFLVLTGGRFVIGPLTTASYVIGLRAGLHQTLRWDFRTTDLDRVFDVRRPCEGTLFVNATSRDGRRRLEVLLAAPPQSFGGPIMTPNAAGEFSAQPGCRESYAAVAHVWAWTTEPRGSESNAVLSARPEQPVASATQLRADIPLAVLEWGGDYQCFSV